MTFFLQNSLVTLEQEGVLRPDMAGLGSLLWTLGVGNPEIENVRT